jgi:hypothetical protein
MSPDSLDSQRDTESQWVEVFRLAGVGVLVLAGFGIAIFGTWLLIPTPLEAINKDGQIVVAGLSPALAACYTVESRHSSIIIGIGFGLTMGLMYYFGNFVYKKFRDSVVQERKMFFSGISKRIEAAKGIGLTEIMNSFGEHEKSILDRRNVYWGLFLRATLAVLVVSIIALLMAVCKIEAQAGLPIITGIIAFVIGQGSEALHGGGPLVLLRRSDDRETGDARKKPDQGGQEGQNGAPGSRGP